MTQQTMCPACGAPLVYEGENDVVNCGFCSTDISVIREDDAIRFEVLAQPEPQKEVLSHIVEPPAAPQDPEAVVEEQAVSEFPAFFSPATSSEPVSSQPVDDNQPGAQVYQPAAAPANTNTRKWVLITLGIVLGLCLLCACAAGAGVLLFSASVPLY